MLQHNKEKKLRFRMRTLSVLTLIILSLVFGQVLAKVWLRKSNPSTNSNSKATLAEFRPLALAGNAEAQVEMGLIHRDGQDVPVDYGLALKWFALAAEQDFPPGLFYLGRMYDIGQGVEQDYAEAMKFRLAADQGDADAPGLFRLCGGDEVVGRMCRCAAQHWPLI